MSSSRLTLTFVPTLTRPLPLRFGYRIVSHLNQHRTASVARAAFDVRVRPLSTSAASPSLARPTHTSSKLHPRKRGASESNPQPRALSDDPAPLPAGYTFYPYHSDRPSTPPTMANIIASPHAPPPLPRMSVFDYLFPPEQKGGRTVYYPAPDAGKPAFIDGLTGEEVTRGQVEQQALWLAGGLEQLGVKRGDVGMTFGFNSLQYVNAIMGMQALGCIVSPANAA